MQSQSPARSRLVPDRVTVLVTGFAPFGGESVNASWEAVSRLPHQVPLAGGTAELTTEELPVTFTGAAARSRELIETLRPDVVLHVGVSAAAGAVRLETTARNVADARIPDNAGRQPAGEQLTPGGAESLRSTWLVGALVGRLRAAGLPVEASDDAGRYVCNATLYSALETAAGMSEDAPYVGFVHVPSLDTLDVEVTTEVLRRLVVELSDQVRRRSAARSGLGRLAVPRPGRPLRLGLTGGIGSGKSSVARLLASHGATVVDADGLAREVVEPGTPGLAAIADAFGPTVLTADGALDRQALAGVVFADRDARTQLESITLPLIAATAAERMDRVAAGAVAVYDVPLLAEGRMADLFDAVIVVETPLPLRLERLEGRGLARDEARARMANQASDEERRALADVLLLNNGTEPDLADGVDWVWKNRIARALP